MFNGSPSSSSVHSHIPSVSESWKSTVSMDGVRPAMVGDGVVVVWFHEVLHHQIHCIMGYCWCPILWFVDLFRSQASFVVRSLYWWWRIKISGTHSSETVAFWWVIASSNKTPCSQKLQENKEVPISRTNRIWFGFDPLTSSSISIYFTSSSQGAIVQVGPYCNW